MSQIKEKIAFMSFSLGIGVAFLILISIFVENTFGSCMATDSGGIAFLLSLVGSIFGLMGLKSQRKKLAIAGLILNIIGFFLGALMSICPA